MAGAATYALDALFMQRPIAWNYREFHLSAFMPDLVCRVERRDSCQLCGTGAKHDDGTGVGEKPDSRNITQLPKVSANGPSPCATQT